MKATLVLASVLIAQTVLAADVRGEEKILTDFDTGRSVRVEGVYQGTLVTDIASGEAVFVAATWPLKLSDADYTEMMRRERNVSAKRRERWTAEGLEPARPGLAAQVGSGNYSISGGSGGLQTPSYTVSAGSLRVSIYGVCSRPAGDYVRVTVWREISFWPDKSYGTKSHFVDSDGETTSRSWTIDVSGKYYLVIDKAYNGYSAYGTFSLSQ